jgi:hypothetical protein
VHQAGDQTKVILRCTANKPSREVGAFVHSFGDLEKDVVTELLVTRIGTLVLALQMAEKRTQ